MRQMSWQSVVCLGTMLLMLPVLGCPFAPSPGQDDGNTDQPAGDTSGEVDERLVVFADTESSLRTNDVYDVEDDVVRFDPMDGSMVWTATGASFIGYPVDGDLIGATGFFQVRFGTADGQRRAFFTETDAATICNIAVNNGSLRISATNVTVPQ